MKRRAIAALIAIIVIAVLALAAAPILGANSLKFLVYISTPLTIAAIPAILLPRTKSMIWSMVVALIAVGYAIYLMALPCSGESCMANSITFIVFVIPVAIASLLLLILRFFIGRPSARTRAKSPADEQSAV